MKLLILLASLLIAACAPSFERDARDLKWRMRYVEHYSGIAEWESLSYVNDYTGDCSNYAIKLKRDYPESVLYWGQLQDGRYHAVTCLGDSCFDTLHSDEFNINDLKWAETFPVKLGEQRWLKL